MIGINQLRLASAQPHRGSMKSRGLVLLMAIGEPSRGADCQQFSRPNRLSPAHRHTRAVDIELVESTVRIIPGAV